MPHIYKCFDTKFKALAFGDLEILNDFRARHKYVRTYKKVPKIFFLGFSKSKGHETWRNAKKIFRFLDRLPYFPYYRIIVLNVKVKSRYFSCRVMSRLAEPIGLVFGTQVA